MPILLGVWALFGGLPAAWLAGEKGRPSFLWFVGGLVLGPVALFMVGFAPRGYGLDFKPCLECREAVYTETTRCSYCGADLLAEEQAEDALDEPESGGVNGPV